jgi:hypothetical protein
MRDLNKKLGNNIWDALESFRNSLDVSLNDSLNDSFWSNLDSNSCWVSLELELWNNLDKTAQSAQSVEETNDA